MKRYILIFVIIIAILGIICYNYAQKKITSNEIKLKNSEYINLYNKEISETELATLINKVYDQNEKNNVEKDDKGIFKDNLTNSINIEIKFKQREDIYSFELIYQKDVTTFLRLYSKEYFKCTKMEYHEKTKLIKYLYFEQV